MDLFFIKITILFLTMLYIALKSNFPQLYIYILNLRLKIEIVFIYLILIFNISTFNIKLILIFTSH